MIVFLQPNMKYKVMITETLEEILEVEASSWHEAELIVRGMYRNEEIVLTADNYVHTEIRTEEITEEQSQLLDQGEDDS